MRFSERILRTLRWRQRRPDENVWFRYWSICRGGRILTISLPRKNDEIDESFRLLLLALRVSPSLAYFVSMGRRSTRYDFWPGRGPIIRPSRVSDRVRTIARSLVELLFMRKQRHGGPLPRTHRVARLRIYVQSHDDANERFTARFASMDVSRFPIKLED